MYRSPGQIVHFSPRSLLTNGRHAKVAQATAASNRTVAEAAGEHPMTWHTVHRALIAAAAS